MMRFILSAVFVIMAHTTAIAQDVTGSITATLTGEERVWFITAMKDKSSSHWSEMGPLTNVNIWGHATDDSIMGSKDALIIQFSLMNGEVFPDTLSVMFSDSSVPGNYYASDADMTGLNLSRIKDNDGQLTLNGAFSATMAYAESYGAPPDRENTRHVQGTFEVTLYPRPEI